MDHLQNWFDKAVDQLLNPNEILLALLENQFYGWGITLSKTQKSSLKAQLQKDQIDTFAVDLSEIQIEQLRKAGYDPDNLILDFGNFNKNGFEQEAGKIVTDLVFKTSDIASDTILKDWKKQANKILKEERKSFQVTRNIKKIWGKPIKFLEVLLSICRQSGSDFNDHFRSNAVEENDLVFEVLTLSHARACQVGFEILVLLTNGFADGAYARWRTLHEITVISALVKQNGQALAERYLDHKVIADYWEAKSYQEHCKLLGFNPLSEADIENLKANRNRVLEHYGKEFDKDYGWAASVLSASHITFACIEKAVHLDHLRTFYKTANLNVHAGSKGILFRLGSQNNQKMILAGASIFGLSEVGRNTAFSISLLTANVLLSKPNLDRFAFALALEKLRDEVCWAFDEVGASLENGNGDS